MNDWNPLSIADFQRRLGAGEVGPLDWWDACREMIEAKETGLGAWACLAPRPSETLPTKGHDLPPLLGVPVGIKDIIETRDLPTTWGTRYQRLEHAPTDAAIVTRLASLGALVMGKTVTTEFAYFQPSGTRNPHDPGRTPGGSSSGSAAAVAAGMVPVALGTQTVGSIIRPASYCGVVGFKPTHGTLPLSGVRALAPSLDTLGWFTRTVEDTRTVFQALTGSEGLGHRVSLAGTRIGLCPIPGSLVLAPEVCAALELASQRLAAEGAEIIEIPADPARDELTAHQHVVLAYEAARELASERILFRDEMSGALEALLEEGERIPLKAYQEARIASEHARQRMTEIFSGGIDFLIAPSATGAAPEGLESTGDPLYSRAWTLLGMPCINLPIYWSEEGLPVGVQLIANRFQDVHLLAVSNRILN
ncbi:amidase [Billgrantia pellis]|uniref:Amidase n=1 Tax=Billgrantia pellis TaxID=2606936 RepID=A0A7V7FX00_9GAMM|nr:amidase [Halomonas pellis]KAA0010272.1 amidase [Halomonas pellis]